MTSSWMLTQRKAQGGVWDISNFGDPNNSLGGWEDHYIINGAMRECHPNYEAIPIGNPYGFMICKKKKRPDGRGLDAPLEEVDPSQFNGYNRYRADLYRPWRETSIQLNNPDWYYDRRVPNEEFLHQRDYLARETKFDGIGVNPLNTPGGGKGTPFREYGYDFHMTKNPPYKYDVQRLHQPYPMWKEAQIYHGATQSEMDRFDKEYNTSVYSATW